MILKVLPQDIILGSNYLISSVDTEVQSCQKYSFHQDNSQVSIFANLVHRNLQDKNIYIRDISQFCETYPIEIEQVFKKLTS